MKKILYVLPVVAMLAAGCGSSDSTENQSSTNNQEQISSQENSPTPTPSPTPTEAMSQSMNGSVWQGTLMASDNSAKGNYKLATGKSVIYIKTSRDYSSLVGKEVNVKYTGTLDSFTLGDITAK